MKKITKLFCSAVVICGAFSMLTVSVSAEKSETAPETTTVVSTEILSSEEIPVVDEIDVNSDSDSLELPYETEIEVENDIHEDENTLPDGNGTLLEDFSDDVVDRQFITIQSKNGSTFYIVIDKDSKGNQNVYFMNLVDEYDLMAFAEDFPEDIQSELDSDEDIVLETDVSGNPIETDDKQADKDAEKSTGGNPMLIIILVLAAGGGGAFYYFKVMKPKKGAKTPKHTDYGDEDEDYEEDTVNEDVSDEDEEV